MPGSYGGDHPAAKKASAPATPPPLHSSASLFPEARSQSQNAASAHWRLRAKNQWNGGVDGRLRTSVSARRPTGRRSGRAARRPRFPVPVGPCVGSVLRVPGSCRGSGQVGVFLPGPRGAGACGAARPLHLALAAATERPSGVRACVCMCVSVRLPSRLHPVSGSRERRGSRLPFSHRSGSWISSSEPECSVERNVRFSGQRLLSFITCMIA